MSCAQACSIFLFFQRKVCILLLDHAESECCNGEIGEIYISDFYSSCFDNECQFFAVISINAILFSFNSYCYKIFSRFLSFFLYLNWFGVFNVQWFRF